MKILFNSEIVFSKKYESFEDLSNEHIDYESRQGRTVPNYNYEAWILELVFFIMTMLCVERQNICHSKEMDKRQEKLFDKLDDLKGSQPLNSANTANAILDYAEHLEIKIEVQTETEAEQEIWDTFQEITRSRAIRIKHNRSIAGKLSKYANKGTLKRKDEEKAWEEQTAEEWRSQS